MCVSAAACFTTFHVHANGRHFAPFHYISSHICCGMLLEDCGVCSACNARKLRNMRQNSSSWFHAIGLHACACAHRCRHMAPPSALAHAALLHVSPSEQEHFQLHVARISSCSPGHGAAEQSTQFTCLTPVWHPAHYVYANACFRVRFRDRMCQISCYGLIGAGFWRGEATTGLRKNLPPTHLRNHGVPSLSATRSHSGAGFERNGMHA